MGLGSLALYGGAMHQEYKPAGRAGNVMPWQNVPSRWFGGINAKAFANLKKSGVPIEYTYKTQYVLGQPVQVVNKYRYTVEKNTPAKIEWWPKGVPLNWGGRVTTAGICATLTALRAAGILTTKEAAALCAIVMARHYEPAQLLAFQLAIINIVSGYAAWKHNKEWEEKHQKELKELEEKIRKNAKLTAAQNVASAAQNAARAVKVSARAATGLESTARRTLRHAQTAHQQTTALQTRATEAAERAAAAATAQALVGLLEAGERRGIEIGPAPDVAQALRQAFNGIRAPAPMNNNGRALQGPRAQPLLLLQQANSSGSQRNFRTNTMAPLLRTQSPRTTPRTQSPRTTPQNNNASLLARAASTKRATPANRRRR